MTQGGLTVGGAAVADPVEGPVGLLLHTRQRLDGVEQELPESQQRQRHTPAPHHTQRASVSLSD